MQVSPSTPTTLPFALPPDSHLHSPHTWLFLTFFSGRLSRRKCRFLNFRVTLVEREISSLRDMHSNDYEILMRRINSLEGSRPDNGSPNGDLRSIRRRLERLEQESSGAASKEDIDALEEKCDEVKEKNKAQEGDIQRLESSLDVLEENLIKVAQKVEDSAMTTVTSRNVTTTTTTRATTRTTRSTAPTTTRRIIFGKTDWEIRWLVHHIGDKYYPIVFTRNCLKQYVCTTT